MVKSTLILKFLLLSNYSINLKSNGLQGLLSILKIESERYANQNGRAREVSEDEFSAFLGIYILMGIHKLPSIKSLVDGGLWNPLIPKTMTGTRFMENLRNIHLTDNFQKLSSKDNMKYDRVWKMRPLLDHLQKHF